MSVAFQEYASRKLPRVPGQRGKTPLEPKKMLMMRMNQRIHRLLVSFCVEEDESQRQVVEAALEFYIINRIMQRRLKAKTKELANGR